MTRRNSEAACRACAFRECPRRDRPRHRRTFGRRPSPNGPSLHRNAGTLKNARSYVTSACAAKSSANVGELPDAFPHRRLPVARKHFMDRGRVNGDLYRGAVPPELLLCGLPGDAVVTVNWPVRTPSRRASRSSARTKSSGSLAIEEGPDLRRQAFLLPGVEFVLTVVQILHFTLYRLACFLGPSLARSRSSSLRFRLLTLDYLRRAHCPRRAPDKPTLGADGRVAAPRRAERPASASGTKTWTPQSPVARTGRQRRLNQGTCSLTCR